ncbi:S8 family serine peptidase [Flavobacterium sp. TP390]|uniref:S8 family serine peptidase n=1 Tax=Flavobacterium profundi TaxID=1774945 RepID=A0A6I4IRS7_9FLAO|nr:S8 family peptidase [Flavobacterium profundi]MVO07747.1 S8 family serine peptidase [Flavobacterium profundi]
MKKLLILFLFVSNCFSQSKAIEKNQWHQDNNSNGISLEKWYKENTTKKSNIIIVATIDSQIDLNHEDLKNQIWVNKGEIPNNSIDDDNNGYIDDINGWSFLGKPNGGYFRYGNFEYTKFVNKYQDLFNGKNDISQDSLYLFNEYKRAKELHQIYSAFYGNWLKSMKFNVEIRPLVEDTLKYFFPKEDYTISQLDSLYNIYKINDKSFRQRRDDKDKDLGALIYYMKSNLEVKNRTINDLIKSRDDKDSILNRNLNIEYNPRKFVGDNPDILKKGYGNNIVNNNTFQLSHNTSVSSIIASNQKNKRGTFGFHDNIQIMPLHISCSGDEYDKDIAMAIYYAVDNGAKVINMSFGKEFSLNQQWVTEAFKYAEKHNVLLIHGSGNNSFNIDTNPYYPSDYDYEKKKDLVTNFINVGSISKRTDSTMVSSFSDYGKNNVDIFAPGEDIYVAIPDNQYKYDSGTSLAAPMVSGTAALIWLYYPSLTAQEVKQIILESGVTINKQVIKPGTENELVPFSELCKSGKILNTYNAMKLAEERSKKKS